MSVICNDLSLK